MPPLAPRPLLGATCALVLLLVLGLGALARATTPAGAAPVRAGLLAAAPGLPGPDPAGAAGAAGPAGPAGPGGLGAVLGTSLDDGTYRLEVDRTTLPAGERTLFSYRVRDARGAVLTDVDATALLLVDRDLSRFARLEPQPSPDGTWSLPLRADPGSYRALVDLTVRGRQHVLGVDLTVPGPLTAAPLPSPEEVVVVDGHRVRLTRDEHGLSVAVTRADGSPAGLAAPAALAALRAGDLALAPVELGRVAAGGADYRAGLGPGAWRVFVSFRLLGGGQPERTAAFTLPG